MIGADGLHQTWVDIVFLTVLSVVAVSSVFVTVVLWRIVRLLVILEDETIRRLHSKRRS